MNLFEMIWPTAKGIFAVLGVGAASMLVMFICMIVYFYFHQCRLVKGKVAVENTMLDLMANFAVAIEIMRGDKRDEEVKRLEAHRDRFNEIVDTYYSDPANKPNLH